MFVLTSGLKIGLEKENSTVRAPDKNNKNAVRIETRVDLAD